MKKFILTSLLVCASVIANAAVSTITVSGNTMTNVVAGSAIVRHVLLSAPTTGAVTVRLYDTPTNALTYTVGAYTNSVTYMTNLTDIYTNYFGVIQTNNWTNVLVTVDQAVSASTNAFNVVSSMSVAGSSSVAFPDLSYYFLRNVWVTNTSPSNATITVTFDR